MRKLKELPPGQLEELTRALEARFEKNMSRHKGLEWAKVQAKLEANTEKLEAATKQNLDLSNPFVARNPIQVEITATKARKSGFDSTGYTYSVQVTNIDDKSHSVGYTMSWKLVTQQNTVYSGTDSGFTSAPLDKGQISNGSVTFIVPSGEKPSQIEMSYRDRETAEQFKTTLKL